MMEANIHDGDWFTDPNITLAGTTNSTKFNWTIDGLDFVKGTHYGVIPAIGQLRFNTVRQFSASFDDDTLDTDVWRVINDTGEIRQAGGDLWLVKLGDIGPLISTIENPFPSGSNWIARISMDFQDYHGRGEDIGLGISTNVSDHMESHLSIYANSSITIPNPGPYGVIANGTFLDDWKVTAPTHWSIIYLEHSSLGESYRVRYPPDVDHTFHSSEGPDTIWIGSTNSFNDEALHSEVWVYWMDIWTINGDWVSEVFEMDGPIEIFDARSTWEQYSSKDGYVDILVRSSDDNHSWSGWSVLEDGTLPLMTGGRYTQLRARMGFPHITSTGARIYLSQIALEYSYPVESVRVRLNDGPWIDDVGIDSWETNLTLIEDGNLVEVRVEDIGEHVNTTFMNLTLDTTPPTGTIGFVGGRTHYNATDLVLELNATDRYGIKKVVLASLPDLSDRVLLDYEDRIQWTIPGGSGEYTIYARYVDNHGLRSDIVSTTIIYDPTRPAASLTMNGGADHTDDRSVIIDLTYFDEYGIASIELSNDPSLGASRFIEVGTTRVTQWDLEKRGSGERTVFMRVRDLAGNEVVVNDTIDLYVPEPLGSVEIEGGAAYSVKASVALSIRPPEGFIARRMQISNDPSFEGGVWEEVGTQRFWSLAQGDGRQSVYVRFEDGRGYRTLAISDSIIVDTTPPTISLVINGGGEYTTDPFVQVNIGYEDAFPSNGMWVSNTDDLGSAERIEYTSSIEWRLLDGEGLKTVHVWISDSPGNIGHADGTIHLATIAPFVHPTLIDGEYSNATDHILVEVLVIDQYGLPVEVQIVFDDIPFDPEGWHMVENPHQVRIPQSTPDGAYYISVRARNELGLKSDIASVKVVLDRKAPVIVILGPLEGSTHVVAEPFIDLEMVVQDWNEIDTVEYRLNGGDWVSIDPLDLRERIELDSFGDQRIEVRAVDEAGNSVVVVTAFEIKDSMMVNLVHAVVIIGAAVLIVTAAIFIWRRRSMT